MMKFMITDFRVKCIKPLVWNAGNKKPGTVMREIELLQDAIKDTILQFAHSNMIAITFDDLDVTIEGSFKEAEGFMKMGNKV